MATTNDEPRSDAAARQLPAGAVGGPLPAVFVLDRRHRIQRARGRLRREDGPPNRAGWLEGPESLGDLMGCINAVVEARPCGQTSRCRYCALQQVFGQACAAAVGHAVGTARPRRPEPVLMERTCRVAGRSVTRRWIVSARPMRACPDAARPSEPARVLIGLREAPPEAAQADA